LSTVCPTKSGRTSFCERPAGPPPGTVRMTVNTKRRKRAGGRPEMLSRTFAVTSFGVTLRTGAVERRGEEPEIESQPWLELRDAGRTGARRTGVRGQHVPTGQGCAGAYIRMWLYSCVPIILPAAPRSDRRAWRGRLEPD
jgi:hypothetical protein